MKFFVGDKLYEVEIEREGEQIEVKLDERTYLVDLERRGPKYDVFVETEYFELHPHTMVGGLALMSVDGERREIQLVDSKASPDQIRRHKRRGETILAPMPGRIIAVHIEEGDMVKPGTLLLTLEAMKMENELTASVEGLVSRIGVAAGDSVTTGQELLQTK